MTSKHKNPKKNSVKKTVGMPPYFVIAASMGVCLLFIYLISNIYLAETISPLYAQLTGGQFSGAVDYLQKTEKVGIYDAEIGPLSQIYGTKIQKAVATKNEERKARIAKIEATLRRNPKARDVLYRLHFLYEQAGNTQKASEYLLRAEAVDPDLIGVDPEITK